MATPFTDKTSSTVYNDDFRDSAGFQKILFNSGKALQARELTQLQTILQNQISRAADNIFVDGAAIGDTSGSGPDIRDYVIIKSLPVGVTAKSFVGKTITNPSVPLVHGGLSFEVSFAEEESSGGDKATLYGKYVSFNQTNVSGAVQNSELTFLAGEEISGGTATFEVAASSPVGKGVIFGVQKSTFYTQGHFVYVPEQEIVVSKYNTTSTVEVGFKVIQDVVSVTDDVSLYDNQGSVPNLSSPGADRYRIRMILTTRDNIVDGDEFVTFSKIKGDREITKKESDDGFNQVKSLVAKSSFDTNGNFIARPFAIRYQGGDSDGALRMTIGPQNIDGPATAFLDGYRLSFMSDSDYSVSKPVSFTTSTLQSTPVSYGNYVNAKVPSASPTAGQDIGNLVAADDIYLQQKYYLRKIGTGLVTGSARIKQLFNPQDSTEGTRIYLYDIKINSGATFRDVQWISKISANPAGATPTTTEKEAYIELERDDASTQNLGLQIKGTAGNNTSLFKIPGARGKSLSNVGMTLQRRFTGTVAAASTTLTITDPDNTSRFVNELQWIIVNTSDRKLVPVGIGGVTVNLATDNATADILGLITGKIYTVFAQVVVPASSIQKKTKTLTRATLNFNANTVAGADFVTGLLGTTAYYDGAKLEKVTAGTEDVTRQFIFDEGQRDNYIEPIRLKRSGYVSTTVGITVVLTYFEWSASGDYFSVDSYIPRTTGTATNPVFSYSDIPRFISPRSGDSYDLRNHIDFRPKMDPSGTVMTAADRIPLPRNNGIISYGAEFYNERTDHISLGYDTKTFEPEIRINKGTESVPPDPPDPVEKELVLFSVTYGGNTTGPTDIFVKRHKYKRFTMSDIGRIETRVEQLEETVSLTALEQSAANLIEVDAAGLIRSKTGFFVDDFSRGFAYTASSGEIPSGDNSSLRWHENPALCGNSLIGTGSVQSPTWRLAPKKADVTTNMQIDATPYGGIVSVYDRIRTSGAGTQNSNYVIKGDTILLEYTDVLDPSLVNEVISWKTDGADYNGSGYYNVNPFNVFTGLGVLNLKPSSDAWMDTVHLPDINLIGTDVDVGTTYTSTQTTNPAQGWRDRDSWFVAEGDLRNNANWPRVPANWGNRPMPSKEIVTTTSVEFVDQETEEQIYGIPWMRQRSIYCKATDLRPNTRYWPFFEKVNVNQFCYKLEKATYNAAMANRLWDIVPEPITTGQLVNPGRTAESLSLVTDADGELYYNFWLPNSAPVASFLGSTGFTTFDEWRTWIDNQTAAAATYGSVYDPQVMNANGWKFKSGPAEMILSDTSYGDGKKYINGEPALSIAKASYQSKGDLNLSQTTFTTFNEVTTNVHYQAFDPLAQSFYVDATEGTSAGVFVTKVDVFLRSAPAATDNQISVRLELREMIAGVPFHRAPNDSFKSSKVPSEVRTVLAAINTAGGLEKHAAVIANPVTFEFEQPVYIRSGVEYAIVLLSDCDGYEAFISTTYDLKLGKEVERVSQQPAKGAFFLSSNGSTWTARQDQNLAYRIHTAKFKSSGHVNFRNQDVVPFRHNDQILTCVSGENRFRVNQFAHGLAQGDSCGLTGLSANTYYPENSITQDGGVKGSVIMTGNRVVASADADGYYVDLPNTTGASGGTFSGASTNFGLNACTTNQAFNFEYGMFSMQSLNFAKTSIDYQGSFIKGISLSDVDDVATVDERFAWIASEQKKIGNGTITTFDSPRMLANTQQQNANVSPTTDNSPSIVVGVNLKSEAPDTGFGGALAVNARANGFTSDVSPILSIGSATYVMTNWQIDNQPLTDGATVVTGQNKPLNYVSETDNRSGSSPSKHITKPITLEQESVGIKVLIDVYKPPAAAFDLYYRTVMEEDILEENWTIFPFTGDLPDNPFSATTFNVNTLRYTEYPFLIGGTGGTLPPFLTFQLKVVMRSTNACQFPMIRSIRAIALAI